MRRSGQIADINPDRRMVAIATEDGYTIIEIALGWKIAVGDVIAWQDGLHIGPAIYENLTRGTREGVFVKDHAVTESDLQQELLR